MEFKVVSDFSPTGDQPTAIKQLSEGVLRNDPAQTLLGVTGSGKTFTVANVIQNVQKPTLILSHNKTLAAQLYSEFKQFFPDNAVEYFVSYYDYYQPEAYLPTTDTYIEKDLAINEEIEKLRLSTTSSLLSGRRDVIVVSSVSCIYGMGNPEEFAKGMTTIMRGQKIARNKFLLRLVDNLYSRTEGELERGQFRVKGDTVDIFLAYADYALRVVFFGDEIEKMETIDPFNFTVIEKFESFNIFPANIFVTSRETIKNAEFTIQQDMIKQVDFLKSVGKHIEAKRLEERVIYDLEMIKELGYCSGIENYSRYFDGREAGSRPFCLLDYFPEDFLMVIDESHVTIPQIKAMYGGDRSRKINLVEYGFRLPAALDNRPLKFEEFNEIIPQVIFVSATPTDYELSLSGGVVVEQLIRPTGLLDPMIEVRPSTNQVDDLMEEIEKVIRREERVLVTTLTKRMAEELSKYLTKMEIRCTYIHSDVDTLDRVEILQNLRKGFFDVLIGVNLLREGLDLPEVSLVVIMDADKEGFLRSERALVQTVGRAARNINGKVIMYADRMTDSMRKTIDETNRRRSMQTEYNIKHNITPTQIIKTNETILVGKRNPKNIKNAKVYMQQMEIAQAADPVLQYLTKEQLEKNIGLLKKSMEIEARQENFIEAARLRDQMYNMLQQLEKLGK
jgi:excinuclease ABC subunit B